MPVAKKITFSFQIQENMLELYCSNRKKFERHYICYEYAMGLELNIRALMFMVQKIKHLNKSFYDMEPYKYKVF